MKPSSKQPNLSGNPDPAAYGQFLENHAGSPLIDRVWSRFLEFEPNGEKDNTNGSSKPFELHTERQKLLVGSNIPAKLDTQRQSCARAHRRQDKRRPAGQIEDRRRPRRTVATNWPALIDRPARMPARLISSSESGIGPKGQSAAAWAQTCER
jgi:hypothetical protein